MRTLMLALAFAGAVASDTLACGKDQVPPGAATTSAELPKADAEKIAALRARIGEQATVGKEVTTREAEERLMELLGYRKVWLKCGHGTFTWMKG